MAKSVLRNVLREKFKEGKSIEQIICECNITRATFYYHKKEDKKRGIIWEEELLASKREDFKDKEQLFLASLIQSFEELLKDDKLTLEKLQKYASTYWKLKAPIKNDEFLLKNKIKESIKKTIKAIADLALEKNDKAVIDFLSHNSDLIINKVFINKNSV